MYCSKLLSGITPDRLISCLVLCITTWDDMVYFTFVPHQINTVELGVFNKLGDRMNEVLNNTMGVGWVIPLKGNCRYRIKSWLEGIIQTRETNKR